MSIYLLTYYEWAVWQLQSKLVQTVQRHCLVLIFFAWIHRTCDYIQLNVNDCVLFSRRVRVMSRVRIGFSVWLCTRICTTFDCHGHTASRMTLQSRWFGANIHKDDAGANSVWPVAVDVDQTGCQLRDFGRRQRLRRRLHRSRILRVDAEANRFLGSQGDARRLPVYHSVQAVQRYSKPPIRIPYTISSHHVLVGGAAQWLGRRSMPGGLSLIYG